MQTIKILYVDDSHIARKMFAESLSHKVYDTVFQLELANDPPEFLTKLERFAPDIVVLDIMFASDRHGGFRLLEQVKSLNPHTIVFMCSHLDDIATIRCCLEKGADDFLIKSYDSGTLPLRIIKAMQLGQLQRGQGLPTTHNHKRQFAGHSLQRMAARVEALVHSAVTAIHILGESGTGKEVVASMIGEYETNKPFVRVNCGAISANLLESELFGHVKGAFTGADRDRKGFLQAASGGWIFLDEVACLSSSAQVALLRVIENQEVIPLGAHSPQKIQVRVISATNEPLDDLVAQGRFRRDLWQRLVETELTLSPLRERKDEIPDLVHYFCQTMHGGPYRVDPSALKFLQSYDWKDGNVRELRNCLRSMTEMHINKELTLLSLPPKMLGKGSGSTSAPKIPEPEHGLMVPIAWDDAIPYNFEALSDRLLVTCIKELLKKAPGASLRSLADSLAIPKSTLARHIQILKQKKLLEAEL
jgi:DNA-binding NtrC family response regulator